MKNDSRSMFSLLPCGVPFDGLKGECCATNCKESAVKAAKDPKSRFLAVEACRFWSTGAGKTTGAEPKKATSKPRKK